MDVERTPEIQGLGKRLLIGVGWMKGWGEMKTFDLRVSDFVCTACIY